MNKLTKDLAIKTFETVRMSTKFDISTFDTWLDTYVMELTRNVVFKCSDIIRETAKQSDDPETAKLLKSVAVDMLDEFDI